MQKEAETTFFEFYMAKGRPPMADEGEKPWNYKGWLLYYVQMAHKMLGLVGTFPDRWSYFLGGMDGPIPQITFQGEGDKDRRNINSMMSDLLRHGVHSMHRSEWEVFVQFTRWLSFGLGLADANDLYDVRRIPEKTQEFWYRTFNVQPFLESPADHFGRYICGTRSSGRSWNPHAFFPTPQPVCKMMAQIAFHDMHQGDDYDPLKKWMSVMEPCSGTGRMLLEASNYSLNLSGMDIDPLMVRICNIYGAIYAPWMAFPPHRMLTPHSEVRLVSPLFYDDEEAYDAHLRRINAGNSLYPDAPIAVPYRVERNPNYKGSCSTASPSTPTQAPPTTSQEESSGEEKEEKMQGRQPSHYFVSETRINSVSLPDGSLCKEGESLRSKELFDMREYPRILLSRNMKK